MSDSSQNNDPVKKLEPRTAGAPTTKKDVFNKLPEFCEDESSAANNESAEEKITMFEALKSRGSHWKRKSVDMLGLGGMGKDGEKKDGGKEKTA